MEKEIKKAAREKEHSAENKEEPLRFDIESFLFKGLKFFIMETLHGLKFPEKF